MLEQRSTEMLRTQEILFVDDEKNVREAWQRLLSTDNRAVATAADGESAISGLSKRPVDLVISDLRMPGVDGLDLLKWLNEHQPKTRFVLITGYGSPEVEGRARALGAYGYLEKPVRPEQLEAIAEAALRGDRSSWDGTIAGKAIAAVTGERRLLVQRLEPAVGAALEQSLATAPELNLVAEVAAEVPASHGALRALARLAVAPILGAAFVVFLPVIGIGAVCYGVGAKIKHLVLAKSNAVMLDLETEKVAPVEATPTQAGTMPGLGRMLAAPFMGLAFIVFLPAIVAGAVCYGIGMKLAHMFRRPAEYQSLEG
jgi:CheY-like chemotaxis protein